jgi:hypothetical protein
MLSIAPPPTIFLRTSPTDMRKSCDGLTGLVEEYVGQRSNRRQTIPVCQQSA